MRARLEFYANFDFVVPIGTCYVCEGNCYKVWIRIRMGRDLDSNPIPILVL